MTDTEQATIVCNQCGRTVQLWDLGTCPTLPPSWTTAIRGVVTGRWYDEMITPKEPVRILDLCPHCAVEFLPAERPPQDENEAFA